MAYIWNPSSHNRIHWHIYSTCSITWPPIWYLIIPPRMHDDVIKWKHFPRYWPFVQGIHRSPVARSYDVFFELRLNKRLSKQSWGWRFETLLRPLWRPCNDTDLTTRMVIIYFFIGLLMSMHHKVVYRQLHGEIWTLTYFSCKLYPIVNNTLSHIACSSWCGISRRQCTQNKLEINLKYL